MDKAVEPRYQIKDEQGNVLGFSSDLKGLREFWLKPESQSLTIVQEFGRKGKYLVQIVRRIK